MGMCEKSHPGLWAGLLCRKRYIDDKLVTSRDQIQAVVNLGAGFDTQAYRPAFSGFSVWELDQRENIAAKQKRLQRHLGAIPSNVKLLSVDFDAMTLA
jgi:methyltransferase (TIGR00027 family)